jgi:signal transduction histidine kinase
VLFNIVTFFWLSPFEERLGLARLITVLAPAYAVVTFYLAARTDDSIEKGDIRRIMSLSLLSTVGDVILIAVWIYATGGPISPYFLLYHASVAASVGRFGLAMGAVSTVASAMAYVAVVVIDGGAAVYPIVVRVGYMFVIAGFSGYLVEIVRRSERDAALAESAAKAYKEVDELKSAFVQNVSHELRTPLTVIRGASSTLRRRHDDLDETQRAALLEMVEKHSAHFGRLIQDLLDFATTTRGELAVSGTSADLRDLIDSEVDRIRPNITQRIVVSAPGESIPLWCDDAKVKRAIHALLDNASKFSEPASEIDVVSELRAGVAVLKVIDRGVGIPEEFHDQIFESFLQIHPAPEGDVSGTGIGLHVAREMVRLHGGDVVVSSSPGEGTTFTVLIPVEPPPEEGPKDFPSV